MFCTCSRATGGPARYSRQQSAQPGLPDHLAIRYRHIAAPALTAYGSSHTEYETPHYYSEDLRARSTSQWPPAYWHWRWWHEHSSSRTLPRVRRQRQRHVGAHAHGLALALRRCSVGGAQREEAVIPAGVRTGIKRGAGRRRLHRRPGRDLHPRHRRALYRGTMRSNGRSPTTEACSETRLFGGIACCRHAGVPNERRVGELEIDGPTRIALCARLEGRRTALPFTRRRDAPFMADGLRSSRARANASHRVVGAKDSNRLHAPKWQVTR